MDSKLNKINWVCYPNKKDVEKFSNVEKNDNTLKTYLQSNNLNFDKVKSDSLSKPIIENNLF